jgi:hypothetical protein
MCPRWLLMTVTPLAYEQFEDRVCAEAIRRVFLYKPDLAIVMAEAIECSDENYALSLMQSLPIDEARLAFNTVLAVMYETSSQLTGGKLLTA